MGRHVVRNHRRIARRSRLQAASQLAFWCIAGCSLCILLFETTLVAQPPAMSRATKHSAATVAPLPSPEPKSSAEPQQHILGLADLEEMAMSFNPAIIRAASLVRAARGNMVQVGLPPNPSIGYEGQQLGSGGAAEQHGVLLSQEIVRGGKLRLNRAVAGQELARAELELVIQQQRVSTDVHIAYYEVLLAQRQIDLMDELVDISREGAGTVDALIQAKEATRADKLQALLEVENSEVLARNAHHRHDAAWQTLGAIIGQPEFPEQMLEGDAYAPPREFDFQEALTKLKTMSPEVAAALSEISRARFVLERAGAETIPNLSVQGLVNVTDNGIGGKPDAGIAVSMPLAVFNRNQGAIAKARHEIAAAQQNLTRIELGMQMRLAPVFERYANARNQVHRYRDVILPAAEESLDLNRQMYQAGESSFLALLTAQRTFSQTNLNYLEALRVLRTTESEIDGLLLWNGLDPESAR